MTIPLPILYVAVVDSISRIRRTPIILKRQVVLLAVLVFAIGFLVRLYKLDSQTLECEELYTIPAATGHQYVYLSNEVNAAPAPMPLSTYEYKKMLAPESGFGLKAVTAVLKRNVHLPAYFYFMHYWILSFGHSEFALRLPSVVFGALAVLTLFYLGTELFGLSVGVLSALLLALSPDQIYFSQQARMYPLLVLLAISSSYLLVLAKRRPEATWIYLFYASISTAGLYTHYEYAFCLAAQVAYVWFGSSLGRTKLSHWLIVYAAIATAFLPWIFITLTQKANSPEVIAWVNGSLTSSLILTEVFTRIARLISVPELPLGWLSVIVAYALLVYGAVSMRSDRGSLSLILCWILFPIAGVVFMDKLLGTRAITITRYWLILGPPLALLMSVGSQRLPQRALRITLSAALIGFMFSAALLTARGELRGKPDRHREMSLYVDSQTLSRRDQLVIAEGVNSIPLALAYYGRNNVDVLRFKWITDQLKQRSFLDILGQRKEVLLLVSGQSQAAKLLGENGFRLEAQPTLFGHVNVAKYVQSGRSPATSRGSQ